MLNPQSRRKFLKSSLTTVGMTQSMGLFSFLASACTQTPPTMPQTELTPNLIGAYGPWASQLVKSDPPKLSFRRSEWTDIEAWRKPALQRTLDCLAVPDLGDIPEVNVEEQLSYDGLHIEKISWQLPYGAPTRATLLKPENATGKLPGILAFHDHGGNKYFGTRKITRTSDKPHPSIVEHQAHYYSGAAWANEIAKRGYVVLVPDAFPFASRRVLLKDVPEIIKRGVSDVDPQVEDPEAIDAYNQWAGNHEHIMSKSLFCAGTTWPAVFFAEDQMALNILCQREDVDENRIGCGGLSGGGMRTVFMAGLDPRIKCAVPVGFMTTWRDFMLHKSYTHTWMIYVPILPHDLDFPEILGLGVPTPSLVLNNIDDQLFTMPEMERSDQILQEVYAKANALDKYKTSFYPGLHKFDKEMQAEAFEWFDRWLKR